jgi:hypothetical protein
VYKRYLSFSTLGSVDMVEYPDSGKMAAGIRNADFSTATYKAMGHVQPAGYLLRRAANDRNPRQEFLGAERYAGVACVNIYFENRRFTCPIFATPLTYCRDAVA